MKNWIAVMSFVVLGLGLAGCGGGSTSRPVSVPMNFHPVDVATMSGTMVETPVFIVVVDDRARKEAIGENSAKGKSELVTAAGDPAEFVHSVAVDRFSAAGMHVVQNRAEAKKVIELALTQFWCTEVSNYTAVVEARANVTDLSGASLWKGQAGSDAKTFGKSRNVANYQKVFGTATVRMLGKLLSNEDMKRALTK